MKLNPNLGSKLNSYNFCGIDIRVKCSHSFVSGVDHPDKQPQPADWQLIFCEERTKRTDILESISNVGPLGWK
jgi:hypothetical protein